MISLMLLADSCAVAAGWVFSYWLRFKWLPVDHSKGVPEFEGKYLAMLPLVVVAHLLVFQAAKLYRPRRDQSIIGETRNIVKAFFISVLAIILIDYAWPQTSKISRQFIITYAVVGTTCFALFRGSLRAVLRSLRRRGWNRRHAAIIGSGRNAQRLLFALRQNSWTGIEPTYFIDDLPDRQTNAHMRGLPVRGPLTEVIDILERNPVDAVFVALAAAQSPRIEEIMTALETTMVDVRLVPDISSAYLLNPNVSELEGLPILSMRQSPIYGWNAAVKRMFDLIVGGICLLIALVPMAIIALLIKLTSEGPVLYKQRRTGLDGREFMLYKFRTMRTDAELATGPVWSTRHDPRRTVIGRFLRRTSLDELPNLFNVMVGQMSLVGPRPERPELIAKFKHEVPRYMLRHKMKAGMTGFAQIRGFRGNTSLKKRIQHDVHYINNWSLRLDMRILAQTITGVWFSKHES